MSRLLYSEARPCVGEGASVGECECECECECESEGEGEGAGEFG